MWTCRLSGAQDVGELIGLSTWDLLKLSTTCTMLKVEFAEEQAELADFALGNWKLRNFIQDTTAYLHFLSPAGRQEREMCNQQFSLQKSIWFPSIRMCVRNCADLHIRDTEEASIAHFDHVNPWLRQHGH